MWADNETSEDLLGFKVHADLIIDVINDETILPVSIGVFGDWGSGKSSILRIIHDELKGPDKELKNNTLVLYFNGWIFEGYDDAKAALLETIIKAFEDHKAIGSTIVDETRKLLKSVNWMRVLGLGFKKIAIPAATAYFTGGLSLIPYLAGELKKVDPNDLAKKISGDEGDKFLEGLIKEKKNEVDETTLIRDFREDFSKMIEKSGIDKLVVLIDDLDRCTHERIIENLEAIKLFLNVDKTAFIIGADPRIVRHAIEHRYKSNRINTAPGNNDNNHRIITDYLEKLIQIPYNLPRLSDQEVETYMSLLFCKRELPGSYDSILNEFRKYRQKNRYSVFGIADLQDVIQPSEVEQLRSTVSLIASLSSIITEGLNGNPRQIKRFLNTFTLRQKLATVASIPDFKIDVLAKLMVLEYAYEDLFKELYLWQSSQEGESKQLNELEKIADSNDTTSLREKYNILWSDPQVLRWLRTDPKLSGIDLRDYYWIARDKLFTSLSGSSLIPTHIRSLFRSLVEHGSASILKDYVTKDVVRENLNNINYLLSLLEKEITKTPEKTELHKIYFELVAQKTPNAINSYKKILQQINHDKIPFSLRGPFNIAVIENPDFGEVKDLFDPKSQMFKGLHPKNK